MIALAVRVVWKRIVSPVSISHAVWVAQHPVLFALYSESCSAWEIVIALRRVVIAVAAQLLFSTSHTASLFVIVAVIIVFLQAQLRFRPFGEGALNTLEDVLLSAAVLSCFLFAIVLVSEGLAAKLADVGALLVVVGVVGLSIFYVLRRVFADDKTGVGGGGGEDSLDVSVSSGLDS